MKIQCVGILTSIIIIYILLHLARAEITGKWDDIANVGHSEEGLEKTLEPETKPSVWHRSIPPQVQIPASPQLRLTLVLHNTV